MVFQRLDCIKIWIRYDFLDVNQTYPKFSVEQDMLQLIDLHLTLDPIFR